MAPDEEEAVAARRRRTEFVRVGVDIVAGVFRRVPAVAVPVGDPDILAAMSPGTVLASPLITDDE